MSGTRQPGTPSSPARDRLLAAAYDLLAERGVGEASLRELAAGLGTSHRMLIYHFGSREGLLAQVVELAEERQREAFADLTGAAGGRTDQAARAFWQRLADPSLAPAERLFFELYGQALQGRPWAAGMLPGVVERWLPPLTELFAEGGAVPPPVAAARARLALATARGLLLDLLATGDRAAVEAAAEQFMGLFPHGGGEPGGSTSPAGPAAGSRSGA
ncbi:TetR/AcrR family transcriptional regulator [Actinacidiphila acididurans]|uniref:TetR/AcrR family transcriptional regulator n=1 Tax=Actinacidiphila acididurans TaxID=2784346 RepID=A0ABS2U2N0_9ACTN|nr:TetR/AcrR family transcriptional regulator [Actinacidiphila acididurans]MBM9509006.1 TetR/AcrR family transcriptional regulator [Actinacidiphila acididurans]